MLDADDNRYRVGAKAGRAKHQCRTPLTAAMVAATLPVSADMTPVNDRALGDITGQSGITIEMQTKVDIGRLSWKDEGSLNINDISLSGQDGGALDNLKMTLDIAGDGETLAHGFTTKQFNVGDMVLHIGPVNPANFRTAIDFRLSVGDVVTQGGADSTTLFSDLILDGYLGPTDIVIRNAGAATRALDNGNVVSDSEMQLDSHFEITDGSLNWEVGDVLLLFNLAAIRIEGLQIHNRRGNDTDGHYGMASVTAKLSAGTSGASGQEGLSIHDVEFRADIDMPVFMIGDHSIGSVSFTDFAITNTNMMIYGH